MMVPPQLPDRPFTWNMAADLGFTRRRLDRLIAEGRVVRVLHGVYRSLDTPDCLETRLQAAALVMAPDAVAVDRLAAWLQKVDTFEFAELQELPPLEVFRLRGSGRIRRSECRSGERDLLPEEIMVAAGVRQTVPLRTCMDLGCRLSRRGALAALDMFMRVWGITREQMYAALSRYAGRRGVVQLRELIPLADPRSESPGESWTRMEIHDRGLPAPEPQHWIYIDGIPVFRLDLAYPELKICVEYDGREFHFREKDRKRDRLRRKWLRDHGWIVIVVTKDDFKGAALDGWLLELRQAIDARS
jgi:hypothetical protein